jgi:hypothetical protein
VEPREEEEEEEEEEEVCFVRAYYVFTHSLFVQVVGYNPKVSDCDSILCPMDRTVACPDSYTFLCKVTVCRCSDRRR